jgi:hypothetical protein
VYSVFVYDSLWDKTEVKSWAVSSGGLGMLRLSHPALLILVTAESSSVYITSLLILLQWFPRAHGIKSKFIIPTASSLLPLTPHPVPRPSFPSV